MNTNRTISDEPAWEIARLFPNQGDLSESDYLLLTEHTNRMAEFKDGRIEIVPPPTKEHQEILLFLMISLTEFIKPRKLGHAVHSPYRVRILDGQFREPDVVFVLEANSSKLKNQYGEGADLVMEVVSEDDPDRDIIDKRVDYAAAGIPEYWIVDPRTKTITVLRLEEGQYMTHSEAVVSGEVHSALLEGFNIDASAVFAVERIG